MIVNDIPTSIQQLIHQVVRRTHLWPSEKRDVRAELESHFREALAGLMQTGLPIDEAVRKVVQEFGDPRVAAKLIRRGKHRSRPIIWKAFVLSARCLLVCTVASIAYCAWLMTGKPSPSVDYVAKMNEPVESVPIEDRAWPILRQVLLDLTPMPEKLSKSKTLFSAVPADIDWPLAVEWLNANRHLLGQVKIATRRRVHGQKFDDRESRLFWFEYQKRHKPDASNLVWTEPEVNPLAPKCISVLLAGLSEHRTLAKLLVLEVRAAVAAGDFGGAWDALETAHRLGILFMGNATIIEQLVGAAIVDLSCKTYAQLLLDMGQNLAQHPDQVQNSFLMTTSSETIRPNYRGEQYLFDDLVQYGFTDDGQGDGHLIARQIPIMMGLAGYPPIPNRLKDKWTAEASLIYTAAMHAGRKQTTVKYREILNKQQQALKLPLFDPARPAIYHEELNKLKTDSIDSHRFALIVAMMPDFERADTIIWQTAMNHEATQAMVALHLYRAQHGQYPEALEALVPQYIKRIPIDVWSSEALRYSRKEDGDMLLYSIWADKRDDGGKPWHRNEGDHVYWPAAK